MNWFLVLLTLASSTHALWSKPQISGIACAQSAQLLFPSCGFEEYGCFCQNSLFVYVVQNCIGAQNHYKSTQMGQAFDQFANVFCKLHGEEVAGEDAWSPANKGSSLSVNQTTFDHMYRGQYNYLKQKDTSVWLGIGLIFYWLLICLAAALRRYFLRVAIRLVYSRAVMRKRSRIGVLIQKHVTLPALYGRKHLDPICFSKGRFQFRFATRFETVAVLVFVFISIIFMLTPYTFMDADPIYSTRWKQMLRYSSDRAGIMATVIMPLFVTFALRNNLLILLTGWSYSTFNTYHRALARVFYALIVVHAVTKHIFSASYHGSLVKYYYPVPYYRWGCCAIGLFTLMIASGSVRAKMYDMFYWLHIVFGITSIACSIMHLVGIGYREPLYICYALWGADAVLRIGRVLLFNFSLFLSPLPGSHHRTYATIRVYDEEMVQITATLPVHWIAHPGQYVYLHTSPYFFYGGHPFSVVGESMDGDGLELICRSRQGLTKRMCDYFVGRGCTPEYPVTKPVYIEGPYGESAPLERYDEGLIIAGGIGITGVIQYVKVMAVRSERDVFSRVHLIWIIRKRCEADPVAWRLADLINNPAVKISIYCTRAEYPPVAVHDDYASSSKSAAVPSIELQDIDLRKEYSSNATSSEYTSDESRVGAVARKNHRRGDSDNSNDTLQLSPKHSIVNSEYAGERSEFDRFTLVDDNAALIAPADHSIIPLPTRTGSYVDRNEDERRLTHVSSLENEGLRSRNLSLMSAGFLDPQPPTIVTPFDHSSPVYYHRSKYTEKQSRAQEAIARTFINGRPDLSTIIRDTLVRSKGSIAILGCGPPAMIDSIRQDFVNNVDKTQHGCADYYEEAFVW